MARAGMWLSTMTLIDAVAIWPALSSAMTNRLCSPSDRPVVFQSYVKSPPSLAMTSQLPPSTDSLTMP